MDFRYDAMTLDWILQIRSTPLEVTEALQEIADEYRCGSGAFA
jgi:hypothetical protein